jgi:hypothetical protein
VSSRVGINKIVRTGHHYSREKRRGRLCTPPKDGEEVFPNYRTLLQNVVPRVVVLAQSFPWFLVIVDCVRIAAKREVIPILGRGSVADNPTGAMKML